MNKVGAVVWCDGDWDKKKGS